MTVTFQAPRLVTDRLVLRAPEARDFDAFATYFGSSRVCCAVGSPDRGEAWANFQGIAGHWVLRGYGSFVAESAGRAIGLFGPWFPEGWPEPELGWSIWDPAAEGKGYAREGMEAVIAHVFGDLGWTTCVTYIAPGNDRSIALAKRLGAWHDEDAPAAHPGDLVYRHAA